SITETPQRSNVQELMVVVEKLTRPVLAVGMSTFIFGRLAICATVHSQDQLIMTQELGIGIVAYSPLGRGFFSSGPKLLENLEEGDFHKYLPRFQPENLGHKWLKLSLLHQLIQSMERDHGKLNQCSESVLEQTMVTFPFGTLRVAHKMFIIWDVSTCSQALQDSLMNEIPAFVTRILWSPDGLFLSVAFSKHIVQIYYYLTGHELRNHLEIEAHIGNVNDLAFLNRDHSLYIITCGQNTTVKIWDVVTGVKLRTLEGHDAPVYSVCVQSNPNIQACDIAPRDASVEHYIQPGSIDVTQAMTNEISSGNVDTIFHIGDKSYATGFLVKWDFFLHLITLVASQVSYMTAIGNHERGSEAFSNPPNLRRNASSSANIDDLASKCTPPNPAPLRCTSSLSFDAKLFVQTFY
ncbi:topless-related protein 4-like protein isoform X1, partial [Tanacetum coccineum]